MLLCIYAPSNWWQILLKNQLEFWYNIRCLNNLTWVVPGNIWYHTLVHVHNLYPLYLWGSGIQGYHFEMELLLPVIQPLKGCQLCPHRTLYLKWSLSEIGWLVQSMKCLSTILIWFPVILIILMDLFGNQKGFGLVNVGCFIFWIVVCYLHALGI